MEPNALATVDQLARWTQWEFEEDSPESAQAEFVLLMASEWARTIAGRAWPDPTDCPTTVVGVVLAASRREIENPRRVTYEVKGPESASYNQAAVPAGFFTDVELKYLGKFRRSGGLWTQATYRDDINEYIGYLAVPGHGDLLPMYGPNDPGWGGTIRP